MAYDLFGNGKTAVKASVNRYVLGEGTGRASTINPIQSNNTMSRQWTDPNGDRIIQGDPFNPAPNGELGASQNLNFGKPVIIVPLRPGVVARLPEPPLQLGVLGRRAARADAAHVGQRVVLPPHLRQLHGRRTTCWSAPATTTPTA